eukprot:6157101-Alexandrium_andersonii.AAC.1
MCIRDRSPRSTIDCVRVRACAARISLSLPPSLNIATVAAIRISRERWWSVLVPKARSWGSRKSSASKDRGSLGVCPKTRWAAE